VTRGQIVHDGDTVTVSDEPVNAVRADKSRTACDKCAHVGAP
jgi:hypothetical protein